MLIPSEKESKKVVCFCAEGSLRDVQVAAGRCEVPRERKLCPGTSGFLVRGLCREKPAGLSAALAACHGCKHEPALSGQLDLLEDSASDRTAKL